MAQTGIVVGLVAGIVFIVAAVYAMHVLARIGGAVERVAESIDTRLGTIADQTGRALEEVSETARDLRARSEQMGHVLREVEAISAALGVVVGAREIVGPRVGSLLTGGLKRISDWLARHKPPEKGSP
jgi:uncharacterized protein YoxC